MIVATTLQGPRVAAEEKLASYTIFHQAAYRGDSNRGIHFCFSTIVATTLQGPRVAAEENLASYTIFHQAAYRGDANRYARFANRYA